MIRDALATLLGISANEVTVERSPDEEPELLIRAVGHLFVIAVLDRLAPGPIVDRAEHLIATVRKLRRKAVPLIAVPFMNEAGRAMCEELGVGWLDLSGNAHIVAPGLRIIVEGRPNRFRPRGRPSSVFAPKSARVARWLLTHYPEALTQREIARATEMDEGFVSRIASRLEDESYVVRELSGALRVKDPGLLLDAWRAEYRFDRHTHLQGHVAARSGDALTRFVSDTLKSKGLEHAATGLSAAWQLSRFASFRIATFFVDELPSDELLETLGFREETRGANLWLLMPNDVGVFHDAAERDGVRCVHPVQAYVDLKGHPERAQEAAERLRADLIASWKNHG